MSQTQPPAFDNSGPSPLERDTRRGNHRRRPRLSLFWRTFFLLAALLFTCILVWLQTLRAIEFHPQVVQTAHQISSIVNLTRSALIHADVDNRSSLIKAMADQEDATVVPRSASDQIQLLADNTLQREVSKEIVTRLGSQTVVAGLVNGTSALWVSFGIGRGDYWLRLNQSRMSPDITSSWTLWLLSAAVVSLVGAALIAQLINRPLKELSFAASRVRDGDFEASRLDEQVATSEIRQVNIGFNRMAQKLSKVEQDRALMLAGISHDLRTPLARLRLETEMSVRDEDAREHMAADIAQLDSVISKFMDYARPDHVELQSILLSQVVESCVYAVKDYSDLRTRVNVPPELWVMADRVELTRVISNLLENARRYGKSPHSGLAAVDIAAKDRDNWVLLKIRDHGMGVAPDALINLTKPFYRGDTARTAAMGTGLGLSIVDRNLQRMGGSLQLINTRSGGLAAHIRLKKSLTPVGGQALAPYQ